MAFCHRLYNVIDRQDDTHRKGKTLKAMLTSLTFPSTLNPKCAIYLLVSLKVVPSQRFDISDLPLKGQRVHRINEHS